VHLLGIDVDRVDLSSSGHFESDAELRRYEALLEMADLVVRHQSLPELFVATAARLRRVTAADVANFSSTIRAKIR
jgi:hypothetical protein